jgi:hypothetical protein
VKGAYLGGEVLIVKAIQYTYTVKEFSLNPSRAIHRALQGVDVTISLRGVPAVSLEQVLAAGRTAIELGIRGADALHLVAAMSAQSAAAMVDEFLFVTYDLKLAKVAGETGAFTAVLG